MRGERSSERCDRALLLAKEKQAQSMTQRIRHPENDHVSLREREIAHEEIPACAACQGSGCVTCLGTGLTAEDCDFAGLAAWLGSTLPARGERSD